jgi:hypothetical protein
MIMVIQMWYASGVDGPSIFLSQVDPSNFDRRYTPFLRLLHYFILPILFPARPSASLMLSIYSLPFIYLVNWRFAVTR